MSLHENAASSRTPERSEKLHKVMARIGYGSRRACEVMISQRRVQVNGMVADVGARVDVLHDEVRVDGDTVGVRPDLVYFLLNKPSGFVSAVNDPQGRPTVTSLIQRPERIYPIGRLDLDSEGLLILTNDGDLTYLITHPSRGVEKEYLVELNGSIGEKALNKMRHGLELEDGITAPARVTKLSRNVIKVVIHEGRNRQIRRMCEAVGLGVERLVRTRIGSVRDSKLKQGEWRELTVGEVSELRQAASFRQ